MVRALLAGTKTQTRRVVKGAPEDWAPVGPQWFAPTVIDRHGEEQPGTERFGAGNADGSEWIVCRHGTPGSRLWVRESLGYCSEYGHFFAADRTFLCSLFDNEEAQTGYSYECNMREGSVPSIHLPRRYSRITLEITGVRVERLQEISEADAGAEGAEPYRLPVHPAREGLRYVDGYHVLWEQINGPGSWDANPWVWVLEFRRLERKG
jgi:hypothetical protein